MKTIIKHLQIFFYVALLFSGLFKGFVLSLFDPTPVLFLISLILMFFSAAKKNSYILSNLIFITIALFFIWATISLLVSISDEIYLTKYFQLILTIFSFFYPVVVFDVDLIGLFKKYCFGFLLICLLILTVIYIKFNFSFAPFFMLNTTSYLVISSFLVLNLFLLISKNKPFYLIIKGYTLFVLLLMGGRGPILFLILIIFMDYFFIKLNIKKIIFAIAVIVVGILAITYLTESDIIGKNRTVERFTVLGTNKDKSSQERLFLWKSAITYFQDNPLIGIGIGSFGNRLYNKEKKEHPHNIFLESLVELGLVGFFLLLAFMLMYLSAIYRLIKYHYSIFLDNKDVIYASLFLFLESQKSTSLYESRILFAFIGVAILVCYKFAKSTITKTASNN